MKKRTKTILAIIIIGIIAAGVVFYIATKKPATSEDSKPVAAFTSSDLIQQLEKDSAVSKKYMFQNIGVEGVVKEVNQKDHSIILDAGESSYINCSFDSTAFEKCKASFAEGKNTKIKGIYFAFDKTEDDGMGLIPVEKTAYLRTCFINNNNQ